MHIYIYIYVYNMYTLLVSQITTTIQHYLLLLLFPPSRAVSHYIVLHQRTFVGLVRDILRKHPCGGKSLHGLTSSVSLETSTHTHIYVVPHTTDMTVTWLHVFVFRICISSRSGCCSRVYIICV